MVTNTLLPQMIGVELPLPGIFTFHLTCLDSLHSRGGLPSVETPSAEGPRHCGHVSVGAAQAALIATAREVDTTNRENRFVIGGQPNTAPNRLTTLKWKFYLVMSSPSKELERMVLGRELEHLGNRVLSWMAGNAVTLQYLAGNIKPDKAKSGRKIDGITALVMALGVAKLSKRSR